MTVLSDGLNAGLLKEAPDPAAFLTLCGKAGVTAVKRAAADRDITQMQELRDTARKVRAVALTGLYGPVPRALADEIQRRADRGLALEVRRGQAEGTVRLGTNTPGPKGARTPTPAGQQRRHVNDVLGDVGGAITWVYWMTDGVTDDQFEKALAQGRRDWNLTRKNVGRLCRLETGRPVDQMPTPGAQGGAPRGRASRRPLPDYARDAGWRLTRDLERIQQILADDRLPGCKPQVAAGLRSHLDNALRVLPQITEHLALPAKETSK